MLEKYTGRLYEGEGAGGGGGASGGSPSGDAHPVVAPWTAATDGPWKVGEAGKEQEWWNTISEEPVREHVKAKGYKNPAELAMANYSLTKMQRGATDVLTLPAKDADANAWNEFYTKVGRPATKDDYKFTFGEGVTVDESLVGFGKEMFHELGARPEQAQKAVEKWNAYVADQNAKEIEKNNKENADAVTALQQSWGTSLEENRAAGERVMKALALDEATMDKIQGAIGAAPLIDLLARIGKKSSEGTLVGGAGGGDPNDPSNMTKEQAEAAINALNNDAEFQKKYSDKNHPEHKDAVDRMQKLYMRS